MLIEMVALFLKLIAGHLVADYPLQGDAIAQGKNRLLDPSRYGVPWYYWMASHAATHAIAVGLITGSFAAGCFEFMAHFLIDHGKCSKLYDIHVDQVLHALCKAVIVIAIALP